jgi:signal transduction histidine kinase
MKLSAHYTRASVFISLTVLFVCAVIYFFAINYIANNQLDKNLSQELNEAKDYAQTSQLPPQRYDEDQDYAVFVKTGLKQTTARFFDTTYYNLKERKRESGRAVEDFVIVKNINYKVTITMSRESTEYLIEIITIITLALITGLLLVLFITNKYMLNGLWKPFYNTLTQIKAFNIDDTQFNPKRSKVDEFIELNEAIYEMSSRITADYQNLKQFTENASHEMMTPLAVVITKLDTLIQDETLGPDQLAQIQDIYASINRSIRLNQSLLLLIKLDNDLVKDDEVIDLKKCIVEKVIQFQELALSKDVTVTEHLADKEIIASKYLIDILLNNLFSNAVRHNQRSGKIEIILTTDSLTLKNTGGSDALVESKIFDRFQKSTTSQGTGLGLALVKNICLHYSFYIRYTFDNGWHVFTISFNK